MVTHVTAVLPDQRPAIDTASTHVMFKGVRPSDVILNILARHRGPGFAVVTRTPVGLTRSRTPAAGYTRSNWLESRWTSREPTSST